MLSNQCLQQLCRRQIILFLSCLKFIVLIIVYAQKSAMSVPDQINSISTHRCNYARTIRSHQPCLTLRLQHICNPDHIMLRDALRYAHDESDLCLERLFNSCGCEWRRYEYGGGIGLCLLDCFRNVGEDGLAEMFGARFLGVRAADYVCAVFDCLVRVEGALHRVRLVNRAGRFSKSAVSFTCRPVKP